MASLAAAFAGSSSVEATSSGTATFLGRPPFFLGAAVVAAFSFLGRPPFFLGGAFSEVASGVDVYNALVLSNIVKVKLLTLNP